MGRRAGRRVASALALALFVSACSLVPKSVDAIFDLSAPDDVAGGGGFAGQLLVPEPSATKALDTDRIAARPAANQYAYLPQAVWADRLPKLFQNRLLETLQNTRRVKAAGLPGQGLLIDFQLVIDIREFEYAREGATVGFHLKLLNDRNGTVVATQSFRAVVPTGGETTGAIVAGLDSAMDEAFREATRWVLARI